MSITDSRLKKGKLTFGPAATPVLTVSCQATDVRLSPDFQDTGDAVEVLCGDEEAASTATTWVLKMTAIQDFDNADGLVNYAMDHDGESVDFQWTPNETSATWSGKCVIKAVEIGGEVAKRVTTDAEWPVIGKPTRTPKKKAEAPPKRAQDAGQAA
ncbi:hypothetical protein P8605_18615 [Streptomyces sp. T-3]|nr:hypothetical protein [Streptomyces sp. T-3]